MESLGVAARHPEQARDRIFGDVDQAGGGPHPAPFAQMIDDGCRMRLRDFRVEQGGATSFGELLATRPTAQEPDAVLAVDFAYREIVLACEPKPLAFRIHTR
jgi:hypothetical protein